MVYFLFSPLHNCKKPKNSLSKRSANSTLDSVISSFSILKLHSNHLDAYSLWLQSALNSSKRQLAPEGDKEGIALRLSYPLYVTLQS